MPTPLKPYKFGVLCVSLCSSSLGNLAIAHLLFETRTRVLPSSFLHEHLEHDNYILVSDLLRLKDLEGYAICDTGCSNGPRRLFQLAYRYIASHIICRVDWTKQSNWELAAVAFQSGAKPQLCNFGVGIVCGALSWSVRLVRSPMQSKEGGASTWYSRWMMMQMNVRISNLWMTIFWSSMNLMVWSKTILLVPLYLCWRQNPR